MNDSKIKVLLVEPEKYPKEIVIDDSLEAMQAANSLSVMHRLRVRVFRACRTI